MKTITKPVTDGVAATVYVWFFKLDMCGHKNRTYFVHLFCIRFILYVTGSFLCELRIFWGQYIKLVEDTLNAELE